MPAEEFHAGLDFASYARKKQDTHVKRDDWLDEKRGDGDILFPLSINGGRRFGFCG